MAETSTQRRERWKGEVMGRIAMVAGQDGDGFPGQVLRAIEENRQALKPGESSEARDGYAKASLRLACETISEALGDFAQLLRDPDRAKARITAARTAVLAALHKLGCEADWSVINQFRRARIEDVTEAETEDLRRKMAALRKVMTGQDWGTIDRAEAHKRWDAVYRKTSTEEADKLLERVA